MANDTPKNDAKTDLDPKTDNKDMNADNLQKDDLKKENSDKENLENTEKDNSDKENSDNKNQSQSEQVKPKKQKPTVGKVLAVIGNIVLYVLIAIVLFVLIVSITSKKDSDGTATIFGIQMRFVKSSSMEACDQTDVSAYKIKSIKVKSCVFINVMPTEEPARDEWLKTVKVGDVLTFKYVYTKQEVITHRVVKIEEKSTGGYIITLEGDNKASEDSKLLQQVIDTSQMDSDDISKSSNYIIGRVTGQSYLLGLLVYSFKTPVGIVCFVLVPCLIMIALQIMRIVKVVNSDKTEKAAKEKQNQANEIEELKRQLAALQTGTPAPEKSDGSPSSVDPSDSADKTENQTENGQ